MAETTNQQGTFTSDGTAKTLIIRSGTNWVHVRNETITAADQTNAIGVEYYWQLGMTTDTGTIYSKSNAANAANLTGKMTSGGFTLVDSSVMTLGALNTGVTDIQTGSPSTVLLASTTGYADGDVFRIVNVVGAQQYGGVDFTSGTVLANTSIDLEYTPSIVAATTGSIRKVVNWNPLFYPRRRVVSSVSKAASGVVIMTVTHGYTVGQKVRFHVPAVYGMTELDGVLATITAINTTTNAITIDVNTTAFTTFAWPLTAVAPFTHAQVVPVGEAAEESYANLLDDATVNTGYIGIVLGGGASKPGGANTNEMSWTAGTSSLVNNE